MVWYDEQNPESYTMAGQLPGVHEFARRRRCHRRGSFDNMPLWGADRRSRRSSFSVYQDLSSTRPAFEYFQQSQAHSTVFTVAHLKKCFCMYFQDISIAIMIHLYDFNVRIMC